MLLTLSKENEMDNIVKDINNILLKYEIKETIFLNDLYITDKIVFDGAMSESKLSNILIDYIFPSISSATVYHYTSRESAENIIESNIFRLTNIAKRANEGEVEAFCNEFNLQGYLKEDELGDLVYKKLIMPSTFYASFTDGCVLKDDEEYFWNTFASCDGVRLKLKITANNCNFRKIFYKKIITVK